MKLAKDILNKEIERQEILLKAETLPLRKSYLKADIHNLKASVKKLALYGVVKSFYCYEELDEKLPRCSKQCVVCRSASRNLQ